MKERRRSERKEVIDSFKLFLVIPERGPHKLYLQDVSEHGLKFVADSVKPFKSGDEFDFLFYVNPSLKLPLSAKVQHAKTEIDGTQTLGCELTDMKSRASKAYAELVKLLAFLTEFVD